MAKPPIGQEDVVFHYMLGKAIGAWAMVEFRMAIISGGFGHYGDKTAVDRLIGAVGAGAKISVIDELIRAWPELAGQEAVWDSLHERLRKQALVRNRLAHHFVTFNPEAHVGHRFRLANPKRGGADLVAKTAFGVVEVMRARNSFLELALDIGRMTELLFATERQMGEIGDHPKRSVSYRAAASEMDTYWTAHLQ